MRSYFVKSGSRHVSHRSTCTPNFSSSALVWNNCVFGPPFRSMTEGYVTKQMRMNESDDRLSKYTILQADEGHPWIETTGSGDIIRQWFRLRDITPVQFVHR